MPRAIFFLIAISHITAHAAEVSGKVERIAGYPVAYARVTLNYGKGGGVPVAYSGGDGTYFFRSVPQGTCTLEIWNGKQRSVTYRIEVREPSTKVPTVRLP